MAYEEETEEAKGELRAAILKFHAVIDPEMFIGDWVLIVHKSSKEMVAEGTSLLGIVVPTDQYFHRTTGLVVEASKII